MAGSEIQNQPMDLAHAISNNQREVNANNSSVKTSFDAQPSVKFKMTRANDPMAWNSAKNVIGRIAYLVASMVIFPLGLARLAGYGINRTCVKKLLIPATSCNKSQINELRQEALSDPSIAPYVERIGIETIDKVTLDTVLIKNPIQQTKSIKDQKFILFFNGNAGFYEHQLRSLVQLGLDNKVNIYTGNYRGVGASTGFPTSCEDLEKDGVAMVEYLLNLGVEPENIMIHGWSLGGGVGAHVARYYQKEGHELHFCNDRSFASLIDQVNEMTPLIKKAIIEYNKEAVKRSKIAKIVLKVILIGITLLLPIVKGLIYLIGWNFKSLEHFKSLKGQKITLFHREDAVIPYYASLYKKLKLSLMTHDDKVKKSRRMQKKIKLIENKTSYKKKHKKRSYHPDNVIRIENETAGHGTELVKLPNHLYTEYKNKLSQVLKIKS